MIEQSPAPENYPMPSPFPGMDPYLESPQLWRGFHKFFIVAASTAINALVPPHYVANINERLYSIQSDVTVFQRPREPVLAGGGNSGGGGTDVAAPVDAPFMMSVYPVEIREPFIEISAVGDEEQVITVIELLSHANKAPGSPGHTLYLTKKQEVLSGSSSLIEIDLLRAGQHTVSPPAENLDALARWDYVISLHRPSFPWRYEVWLRTVRQPLPRISIPLAGDDPDVALDLQSMIERVYTVGGYSRRIRYD
ncbi:MAG: DUF4058 family protein, partial [Armatimonadota bacterium]|nr:DUF4058 family protein [Armatimonadota bacterium]